MGAILLPPPYSERQLNVPSLTECSVQAGDSARSKKSMFLKRKRKRSVDIHPEESPHSLPSEYDNAQDVNAVTNKFEEQPLGASSSASNRCISNNPLKLIEKPTSAGFQFNFTLEEDKKDNDKTSEAPSQNGLINSNNHELKELHYKASDKSFKFDFKLS